MYRSSVHQPITNTNGVVRGVDPVRREVEVSVEGIAVSFDVPPACIITLRGERVKLRLIQPGDRVRMVYSQHLNARIAESIEIQPGGMSLYPAKRHAGIATH